MAYAFDKALLSQLWALTVVSMFIIIFLIVTNIELDTGQCIKRIAC